MSVHTVHHCIYKYKLGLGAIHVSPTSRNTNHLSSLSGSGMDDTKCPLVWRVLLVLENHGCRVFQTKEENNRYRATCKQVWKPESTQNQFINPKIYTFLFIYFLYFFCTAASTLITMWLWNGWLHVCLCVCCVTGDLLFIRYFVTWCV